MSDLIALLANEIYTPVAFLLILGGFFFLIYSRFAQYKYFKHAINILRGKYVNPDDPGQINPYQALSTALASTVGMGNMAGVAAAISIGGPGALFWMWVTAFVGMSTNFFTSALAIMYRGKDSAGEIQGGPMYVIREAMSKKWQPLAYIFCICTLIGCLPIFQANQLTQAIVDIGISSEEIKNASFTLAGFVISTPKFIIGFVLMIIAAIVILGGIQRIGNWAGKMVPLMIVIYFLSVLVILAMNFSELPSYLWMIVTDAFAASHYHGSPILGGITGSLIITGIRRASFSNEAGVGTAPLALGASKSNEPIREGLVSMLSPAIDTLIVCTLTALAILSTGIWLPSGNTHQERLLLANNTILTEYTLEGQNTIPIGQATDIPEKGRLTVYADGSLDFDPVLFGEDHCHLGPHYYNGPVSFSYTAQLETGEITTQEAVFRTTPQGVTATANAFEAAMPGYGKYILLLCAFFFSITSVFSYSYYGSKTFGFLIGAKAQNGYNYFYLITIILGAIASMQDIMNIIDISYAIMAIPTMVSGLILAPKVLTEAKAYFARLKEKEG
jgi:alanine or glycine:cation symporter, AGCS family